MTDAEYQQIIAEMREIAAAEPDRASPAGERLEELAALAEAFEEAGGSEDDGAYR